MKHSDANDHWSWVTFWINDLINTEYINRLVKSRFYLLASLIVTLDLFTKVGHWMNIGDCSLLILKFPVWIINRFLLNSKSLQPVPNQLWSQLIQTYWHCIDKKSNLQTIHKHSCSSSSQLSLRNSPRGVLRLRHKKNFWFKSTLYILYDALTLS